MERTLIITKDGSHSIAIPAMNVSYHSIHGAVQESMHVFIEAGFHDPRIRLKPLQIFEMGFGTGLNVLLTMIEADKFKQTIHYTAVELFPLKDDDTRGLNYCDHLKQPSYQPLFEKLHQCDWEKEIAITPSFNLLKTQYDLLNYSTDRLFNLAYYDAFAPAAQPELWTKDIFVKISGMMDHGGILVTYCSKGEVRRAMQSAGFIIEKIPGPPGKREMIRAIKK